MNESLLESSITANPIEKKHEIIQDLPSRSCPRCRLPTFILAFEIILSLFFLFIQFTFKSNGADSQGVRFLKYGLGSVFGSALIYSASSYFLLKILFQPPQDSAHPSYKFKVNYLFEKIFEIIFSEENVQALLDKEFHLLNSQSITKDIANQIIISPHFQEILSNTISDFFLGPDGTILESLGFTEESLRPFITKSIFSVISNETKNSIQSIIHSPILTASSLSFKAQNFAINRLGRINQIEITSGVRETMNSSMNFVLILTTIIVILFSSIYSILVYFIFEPMARRF